MPKIDLCISDLFFNFVPAANAVSDEELRAAADEFLLLFNAVSHQRCKGLTRDILVEDYTSRV